MPKQSDDLTRKGDDAQRTPKAKLKIPVPSKEQIFGALDKIKKDDPKPSRSSPRKRRTSPDQ